MKLYCPVCLREIATDSIGRICRHGFKRNLWQKRQNVYTKVDGSPCKGTRKFGLTFEQIRKNND